MTSHQTIVYNCLSCGSVVRARSGAEVPQCCGIAMVETSAEPVTNEKGVESQVASHCETKPPVVKGRIRPH